MDKIQFAKKLKIKLKTLTFFVYKLIPKIENEELYKKIEIIKKNGKIRIINSPPIQVKRVQRKISDLLSEIYFDFIDIKIKKNEINQKISHGFVKGKNIKTNAKIHINKKIILNIDIKNFFDSIHFGRVFGFFKKSKIFNFSDDVSFYISRLACYKGKLPQGSPCSPIISNLIFGFIDIKILKITKKYKLDYTRYADDLTFSTNEKKFLEKEKQKEFLKDLEKLLKENGFLINKDKTKSYKNNYKQMVTGLIVNKKINTDKTFRKNTRAMVHKLIKEDKFFINEKLGTLNQLEGRLNFIHYIDTNDKNSKKNLNSREMNFKFFLFYKYLYKHKKPLIITEGKTDVKHLKAAIMKNYKKFPNLIERINDVFNFKVSFFKRKDKNEKNGKIQIKERILNLNRDGASIFQHIFNLFFFVDKKTKKIDYSTFFKLFQEKSNKNFNPKPIIMIFDNETKTKDKPLKSFLNSTNFKTTHDNLEIKIDSDLNSNLFVFKIPLVKKNKKFLEETEIEDLYYDENGNWPFDKFEYEKCKSKKNDFANYIIKNYKNINFTNFNNLLEKIDNLIKEQISTKKQ